MSSWHGHSTYSVDLVVLSAPLATASRLAGRARREVAAMIYCIPEAIATNVVERNAIDYLSGRAVFNFIDGWLKRVADRQSTCNGDSSSWHNRVFTCYCSHSSFRLFIRSSVCLSLHQANQDQFVRWHCVISHACMPSAIIALVYSPLSGGLCTPTGSLNRPHLVVSCTFYGEFAGRILV